MSVKNGCPNPKCDDPDCKLGKIMQSGGPLTAEERKAQDAITSPAKEVAAKCKMRPSRAAS